MSALDQVLTIGILKTEHPNLALKAAAELFALEAVAEIAQDVDEWLVRCGLGGTAHQTKLHEELSTLRKAQE